MPDILSLSSVAASDPCDPLAVDCRDGVPSSILRERIADWLVSRPRQLDKEVQANAEPARAWRDRQRHISVSGYSGGPYSPAGGTRYSDEQLTRPGERPGGLRAPPVDDPFVAQADRGVIPAQEVTTSPRAEDAGPLVGRPGLHISVS